MTPSDAPDCTYRRHTDRGVPDARVSRMTAGFR